jgi:hypothetical protein
MCAIYVIIFAQICCTNIFRKHTNPFTELSDIFDNIRTANNATFATFKPDLNMYLEYLSGRLSIVEYGFTNHALNGFAHGTKY